MKCSNSINKNDTRNYGIDALRMLSMFMVILIHILNRGGIPDTVQTGTAQYNVSWALFTLSFCAVDCFALVTGYLMVNRKFKYSRIIELWLLVVFYSIVITVVGKLVLNQPLTNIPWKQVLLPVSHKSYWYFTAYFGLFCIMPFINKLLCSLSKKGVWILFGTILFLFLGIKMISKTDIFFLNLGYSFLWVTAVYTLGACIRILDPLKNTNRYLFLLGYLIAAAYAFLFLPKFVDGGISYISTSVLIMAIMLLLFFTRCKVLMILRKPLRFLSPLSFAVYIIHTQSLIWEHYMGQRFAIYVTYSPLGLIGAVLLTALMIYFACNVFEIVRIFLFKLIRLDKLSVAVGILLDKILNIDCPAEQIDTKPSEEKQPQ